jgi:hypothetical protein
LKTTVSQEARFGADISDQKGVPHTPLHPSQRTEPQIDYTKQVEIAQTEKQKANIRGISL